ncbi:MAG: protein kinase [Cyanobacteria bacterium J06643_5]
MLTDTILRNRYKILKELGRGGFSVTYLAVDMDLPGNPKCVVKQLKTRHSNNTILQIAKKLFNREAQVLYRLGKGHKQIPEMFAHFEENDEFYLVQEFVDGHDLTKEIKPRHRLTEAMVIKLLKEILEVLSFVHENNVIHRDIKLRNIMRRREDGKIVLIDFGAVKEIKGLAKNEQGDVNSTLIIGTPGYMPDEQANGKPRLCSDVYAVGMLGIQALTGISPRDLPFNPNNGELIWRDCAKVSDRLADVLTGMVRHHFSQRYQTAAEALAALQSPVAVKPKTSSAYEVPPVTLPSTVRQPRPALQTLGLAGLMGVGFSLGVFGWNFFQSSSNGNEPVQTKEIPATVQKINPSVKPETFKLNPPPTFSPSANRKEGSSDYPALRSFPIGLFFRDISKTSETKENSKLKEKINKTRQPVLEYKPKPVSEKTQPASKASVVEKKPHSPTFVTPEVKNKQEPLPSISIPVSEDKKEDTKDESPASVTATPQAEKPPSSESPKLQKDKNEDSPEPTIPTPKTTDSAIPVKDKGEDSSPETSNPGVSDSVDEEINNPSKAEQSDKDKEEENKPKDEPRAEKPETIPLEPDTPAIKEDIEKDKDSILPSPTPSPVQTSDTSVVVPTAKPLLEDKNFFYTVPTSPYPIPENESSPTLSPQPNATPKAETQSTPTPQPTTAPENETQSAISPQLEKPESEKSAATPKPTETPVAQPTPTPQPTSTPQTQQTPQAEATPQSDIVPSSQMELPTIPEVYASPSPQVEVEVITPQISASPLPQTQGKANPSPTATPEPGLSLKRFAI